MPTRTALGHLCVAVDLLPADNVNYCALEQLGLESLLAEFGRGSRMVEFLLEAAIS